MEAVKHLEKGYREEGRLRIEKINVHYIAQSSFLERISLFYINVA